MVILGIPTCDTCRKARAALPDATFRDIRKDPLSEDECAAIHAAFGDAAVNRASSTWRALSVAERERPIPDLIAAHPTVLKRPVFHAEGQWLQGWTDATREALARIAKPT